ncbi:MAG: F0F1 ATP synthase subunit delta [Alteromonadaceae bacterium]|nr:MAG: F0F1 ATP synthase subunit delta [Alteromonadaceae bacterium]
MAELNTLARPYARAAFEFARGAKALASWSKAFELAAAVSQEQKVEVFLSSPNLTTESKGAAFTDLLGDALDAKQQNFVKVLAENSRLGLLPQIQLLFDLYKTEQEKVVDVDILSAFEMSPELEKKLVDSLTTKLDREVNLQTSVDKSLLGGALIRAGDTVIDGSVRGRLARLTEALHV